MNHPYARPLDTLKLVEDFLETVLQVGDYDNPTVVENIRSSETEIGSFDISSPTISFPDHRVRAYRSENNRWKLRGDVVNELFKNKRLLKDDDIVLGSGGALPRTPIKKNRQIFLITGLPASGKSGIASKIADHYGAVILDSDYSKRKLPEFKSNKAGATLVHEEADALIFGGFPHKTPDNFMPLVKLCTDKGMNLVVPKIGHAKESTLKIIKTFKEKYNYDVHLTLISLDRQMATVRALERFKKSRRYVPLSLIFDGYSNDPILTYYRLKVHRDLISSYGKITTVNKDPMVIETDPNNPACLFLSKDI